MTIHSRKVRSNSDHSALVVKNTFLEVNESSGLDRAQRRNNTVPVSLWQPADEESLGSTSCGDETGSDAVEKACQEITHSSSSSREHSPCEVSVSGSVWEFSRDADEAWTVQQAFEMATSEQDRCKLAREFEGRVAEAAQDLNANFVLQKMVMVMHTKSLEFVVREIRSCSGGTCSIASNRYGCRVIQRLLEYCSAPLVAGIVDDLLAHGAILSSEPYAKYAMQCLLEHGTASQIRQFMQLLVANVSTLSVNMHGLSVLGKALSTGPLEERIVLANSIASVPGLMKQLSRSKQGHFVSKAITKVKTESAAVSFCLDDEVDEPVPATIIEMESSTKSSAPAKHRRRGKGGGAMAQKEAEIRDLISSLEAACRRGCPERIAQALGRTPAKLEITGASPALIAKLVEASDLAHQTLNSRR